MFAAVLRFAAHERIYIEQQLTFESLLSTNPNHWEIAALLLH